jgi:hypothetical protein
MPTTWFIARDGKQHGPITDIEFRKLVELGHLKGTDYVWHEGAPDWMPGAQFLGASAEVARPEPPASQTSLQLRPSADTPGGSGRLRLVVVAVSVVLGVVVAAFAMFAAGKAVDSVFRSPPSSAR